MKKHEQVYKKLLKLKRHRTQCRELSRGYVSGVAEHENDSNLVRLDHQIEILRWVLKDKEE